MAYHRKREDHYAISVKVGDYRYGIAGCIEREADACLIAAAPELYEAADAFVVRWMADCNNADLPKLATDLLTALARARGEQP